MENIKEIRQAARTVIIDESTNKIAILEVKGGAYHKIPGGGVEDDESLEEAALREALEEGACVVELLINLGETEFESPDFKGLINRSVCFLARKVRNHKTTAFTEEEMKNKFKLLWLTFEEAIEKFKNVSSNIEFELEMNNRDLKYVMKAKAYLDENKNEFTRKSDKELRLKSPDQ
jgi:8-oxo-dGTP diphosphatase